MGKGGGMNREEMGSRATTQAGPVARTFCAVVGSNTSFVLGDLRAGPERHERAVPTPSPSPAPSSL